MVDEADGASPVPAPPEPPGGALRRPPEGGRALERLAVRVTIRVLFVGLAFFVLVTLAWRLRALLLLISVSVFIAVLVDPVVRLLTRRGASRLGATLVVYLVLVGLSVVLGYAFLHPVYVSATHFAHDLPGIVSQAQHGRGPVGRLVTRLHLASYVSAHASTLESDVAHLGKPALSAGKTALSGVVSLTTIAFLSFFIVLEVPKFFDSFLATQPEERARSIRRAVRAMTRRVGGFMLGDLATSFVAGIVVFVTLTVTGVPFAAVLAIWVALVDFLPLIGGLLGGVAAIGVAFLHSVTAGVVTVVVFLVYQQVENHMLNPLIISRTVRLNPLVVLMAVLIGAEVGSIVGSTFGAICGAIFAVPAAGAVQVGLAEMRGERRALRETAAPAE